jgi:hypothetical protein
VEKVLDKLQSLTPEQRRYLVRMLRESADFIESAISEPVAIGPLVWAAMLGVEAQAEAKKQRPSAA